MVNHHIYNILLNRSWSIATCFLVNHRYRVSHCKSHPSPMKSPFFSWLVVSIMAFIFHFIYGMSSFPLTNSSFSRWAHCTTNQISYRCLIGGLEHGFYDFPYAGIGNVILPTDESDELHDFSEGWSHHQPVSVRSHSRTPNEKHRRFRSTQRSIPWSLQHWSQQWMPRRMTLGTGDVRYYPLVMSK